jgi:hypothetical protein
MSEIIITSVIFLGLGFSVGYGLCAFSNGLNEHKGEGYIRKLLTRRFNTIECHVLNNLTLPIDDGTTQIDHVLVSTRGVFVIETKNYSGWIFGNEKSAKWTQVIYKKKSSFQNPLRQNYKHQKVVQNILDFLPQEAVHSVVVFTGSAEFKTKKPAHVFDPSELIAYIESQPIGALSQNRVAFVVGRLECARYQMSGQTDFEHQSHLIKKFGEIT